MWQAFVELPLRWKIMAFAVLVVAIEVGFRRLAPDSRAYELWTGFFQGIGKVWTAVILSIVYFVSVSLVGIGLRIVRKDPLDRSLAQEPSFWRPHDPNPLGAAAAARHQF
jgi:hypothetical protein